jgi:hypothetical protein
MDMDFLKGNLKAAIMKMPADLQLDFSKLWTGVEKHIGTFEKIGPAIWELLGNDVMALGIEWQCNMLDKDQLSKVFREAFGECGIVLPDDPKPKG